MPSLTTTNFPLRQYLTVIGHDELVVKIFMQDQDFSQCLFDAITCSPVAEVNSILSIFAARLSQLIQFQKIALETVQKYFVYAQCQVTQLSLLQQTIVHSLDKVEKIKLLISFFHILINNQVISRYCLSVMIAKPNALYSSAYNYFCTLKSNKIHSNFFYNELLIQWQSGILSSEMFSAIQIYNITWALKYPDDNNIQQQFLNLNVLIQTKQLNFNELRHALTFRYKAAFEFAMQPDRSNRTLQLFMSLLRECVNNAAWSLAEYHQYIEKSDLPDHFSINDKFFDKFPCYTHELKVCLEERKQATLNMEKAQKERECNALINSLPGLGMLVTKLSLFNTKKEFSYFSYSPSNQIRFDR